MPRTVTHKPDSPNNDDVLAASEKWASCKPPYTSAHMKICVAAAKIILAASGVARRSKYEKENYIRIDFSKAGKVTFYAEFPKKRGLKGKKLGEWPELAIQLAREKALGMAEGGLRAESVHAALEMYRDDLKAKVARQKLSPDSLTTYGVRIDRIKATFGEREVFSDVTYPRLVEVLDEWIATRSNNNALESSVGSGSSAHLPFVMAATLPPACLTIMYLLAFRNLPPHGFLPILNQLLASGSMLPPVPLYTRKMLFAS